MNKLFRHITAFILLVFYLVGFCGFNLIKHQCNSCDTTEFHVVYDIPTQVETIACCSTSTHHIHQESESTASQNRCCDLDYFYAKINPLTTFTKATKLAPPMPLTLDVAWLSLVKTIPTNVVQNITQWQTPPPLISTQYNTIDKLCCFIC
ncbi:hypothetical protein EYV94_05075 [Puteibacter caeruleilacunae]|nr:hypothetical protein EYV94_05075 [Puteibacter caeruleilacunae]